MSVAEETPSAWHVTRLRFTTFHAIDAELDAESVWKGLFEEPPRTITKKMEEGKVICAGKYSDALPLRIETSPMRVDVISDFSLRPGFWFDGLPRFEESNTIFTQHFRLCEQLLQGNQLPRISRVAFGPVLIKSVANKAEGYRALAKLLPVELDAEGSSEFLYQINRPRRSKKFDCWLNRLSKWSVLALSFGFVGDSGQMQSEQKFTACKLELDINTDPEYTGELGFEILGELANAAKEIAENGDRA